MRVIVRWIGVWLLAGAFVALVVDGVKWLANGAITSTPLGQFLYWLSPGALNLSQAVVERYTLPVLWDPVMIFVLNLPIWVVAGALGFLFAFLGRSRTRRVDG
ncbi:MAG: hypothetical protein KDE57_00435 [Calditrichaeota bacterium]|nr:hypothetical protein [Calditrichota bacterium]